MTHPIRPRRTMLYVSGDNARHLEKSPALSADSLIFDLHESVPLTRKAEARRAVVERLSQGGFRGQELVVRVNPLHSRWVEEDVRAVTSVPIDAVLFPVVERAADVHAGLAMLHTPGGKDLAIMVSVETAMGVLHAEEIAAASERTAAVLVNTTNLSDSLHTKTTAQRGGLATSFGLVILAARAYGKAVIDGPHTDIRDAQSCEFSCRQGRDYGFDGKAVIHPVQLPYTNEAFTPTPKEVEKAEAIIAAMEAEHARPYTLLDGQLLEPVELLAARRCIALHQAITERKGAFPELAPAS